ncbi:hypothetical protein TNCV_2731021 [Trichonephila clavipes]|nr:hypothetical protein TNCV_2731021 [Trichonephila clavipes]
MQIGPINTLDMSTPKCPTVVVMEKFEERVPSLRCRPGYLTMVEITRSVTNPLVLLNTALIFRHSLPAHSNKDSELTTK